MKSDEDSLSGALKKGASLDLPAMREFVRQSLSPASLPTRLELFESLPRNSMGKVVKAELRRMIEARSR